MTFSPVADLSHPVVEVNCEPWHPFMVEKKGNFKYFNTGEYSVLYDKRMMHISLDGGSIAKKLLI